MMKVMKIKNIIFRFIGTGYQDKYQPHIKIYNLNNRCLFKGRTYNGKINVCLNTNKYYLIEAKLCSNIIKKVVYVNDYQQTYIFIFNNAIIKHNLVTFLLTDQYYDDLPIEKGKVILWQRQ